MYLMNEVAKGYFKNKKIVSNFGETDNSRATVLSYTCTVLNFLYYFEFEKKSG